MPKSSFAVWWLLLMVAVTPSLGVMVDDPAPTKREPETKQKAPTPEKMVGRVVFLYEELAKATGIEPNRDALQRVLALKTEDGKLLPLIEDVRGGAFRKDKRLREMKLELVVRRQPKTPLLQVLRVFEVTKDGKAEIVYWCDICAITMYELRDCACCQGPIEMIRR